jgi:hypothetical protein
MVRGPILLCLVAIFVLLASSGAAMTLELDGPTAPITPEQGQGTITATVSVPCDELAPRTGPDGALVELHWTAPHVGFILAGTNQLALDSTGCLLDPLGTLSATTDFIVQVTRDVPGLRSVAIPMEAALLDQGTFGLGPVTAKETALVTPDYFGLIQVRTEEPVQRGKDRLTFDVKVTNLGNARTQVSFAMVSGDTDRVHLPDPVVLASPTNPVSPTHLTVQVLIDATRSGEPVRIAAIPAAADDPDKAADAVEFNLLAAPDRGIPGPGLLPAAPGLLACALAARRRL